MTIVAASSLGPQDQDGNEGLCFVLMHPALGYLGETVFLAKRLYGIRDYTLYCGPSSQPGCIKDYRSYLIREREEIESGFQIGYSVKSAKFRYSVSKLVEALRTRAAVLRRHPALLFACRDTIIRGRYSRLYCFAPIFIRRLIEFVVQVRGIYIYDHYLDVLSRSRPTLVSVPHTTYVEYVSLIEACVVLKIDCMSVGDEVSKIIKQKKVVYHGRNDLPRYLALNASLRCEQDFRTSVPSDKTSLFNSLLTARERASQDQESSSALVILTHCLRDANYVSDPKAMLFQSFFEWTMRTVTYLMLNKSDFDWIVYKVHPHAHIYRDKWILTILGYMLCLGVNRKKVRIVSSKGIDSIIDANKIGQITPVTFSGSVSNELACLGIGSIAAGKPMSVKGGYRLFKDVESYYKSLVNPVISNDLKDLSQEVIEDSKRLRSLLSETICPMQGALRQQLNVFYHFGRTKKADASALKEVMNNIKLISAMVETIKEPGGTSETIFFR